MIDIYPIFNHPRAGLLFLCLALALAFEFVNGFHDTANAVATVIYTRSLKPAWAVVLSGCFNFLGVILTGTGVAFGILKLIPMQVLTEAPLEAPLSVALAALLAAITWNTFTWYLGIPASSSHTLIGSILGVGIAHSMLPGQVFGNGVDWNKAQSIAISLLVSPLIGFFVSMMLYFLAKGIAKNDLIDQPVPEGERPALTVRLTLILTCIGISFAHGSNDGQKGVGLIMLILAAFLPGQFPEVPLWVVMAVAFALGLGTMVGWKRIVVTVGEKIGRTHLTPLQGASAEIVAAATISMSSVFGLPVSTTHVLSSGIAGTMMARGSGVQRSMVTKIILAWVLTLPVAMLLSAGLFFFFRFVFGIASY